MTQDTILFFNKNPEALPLYEAFEQKVLSEIRDVTVKVQKTQISFSNKRNFAFASLLPVRKAKERPKVYLTITFGLSSRVDSPRIDGAVEAYPSRDDLKPGGDRRGADGMGGKGGRVLGGKAIGIRGCRKTKSEQWNRLMSYSRW